MACVVMELLLTVIGKGRDRGERKIAAGSGCPAAMATIGAAGTARNSPAAASASRFKGIQNKTSCSRSAIRPGCTNISAPWRAWGMPGASAPAAARVVVVNTRVSHHGYAGTPGIPARDGFNRLLRALPGDRAFL